MEGGQGPVERVSAPVVHIGGRRASSPDSAAPSSSGPEPPSAKTPLARLRRWRPSPSAIARSMAHPSSVSGRAQPSAASARASSVSSAASLRR